MARKPFKIVNNLDLSGNEIIDVSKISRASYNQDLGLDLYVTAGSDSEIVAIPNLVGGTLHLKSGLGGNGQLPGAVHVYVASGDLATTEANAYGLTLSGTTSIQLKTSNQDITLNSGSAAIKITSAVDATLANTGALQIAGGAYITKDLIVDGGDVFAITSGSVNIFNTPVTTSANLAGYATTVNIANLATAARTINIATNSSSATSIIMGSDAASSYTYLRGRIVNLGESTVAATTVKVGGAYSGNTLKIASTTSGTINLTTDVTTGIINQFTTVTGTANLFDNTVNINLAKSAVATVQIGKDASTVKIGQVDAKLYVGTTRGTIDIFAAGEAYVFDTNATTVYAFRAATNLNVGASTGTITLGNPIITGTNLHTFNFNGANSGVLRLAGSTASTLSLFDDTQTTVTAFHAATSLSMGAQTGSFNIRNLSVYFNNATRFDATKLTTINLGTATTSATIFTLGTAGQNNTININGNNPTFANGTSGSSLTFFDTNVITASILNAATTIDIGAAGSSTVTFNSTKNATNKTDGGVAIAGGLSVNLNAYIGGNLNVEGVTTLGNANTDTTTIRGKLTLADSSATYPLTLGNDVNLYRSAANVLTIDDSITMTGAELKGPSTWNIGSTTDNLNIGKASAQTTIKSNLTLEGTIPYIQFNTNPTGLPLAVSGLLYYNNVDEALEYKPTTNGVAIPIGQKNVLKVKNNSLSVDIPDGTPVYAVGNAGTIPLVAPGNANNNETSKILGIATQNIAANNTGFITTSGIVRSIDLTALGIASPVAGQVLYLDVTAGKYTTTAPTGTNYVVTLGWILDATTVTACNIYVRIAQSWAHTATFNALRVNDVVFHNSMLIPVKTVPAQTIEGQLVWNSTNHFLTAYNGTRIVTYVDTDSSQDLSGKTYNGLTLTENATGFLIAGGISVEKTLLLGMDLTVQTGKVVLIGNSDNTSQLVLPKNTFTINSSTTNYAAYYSASGTLSGIQYLPVGSGGTGKGTLASNAILTGNGTSAIQTPGATLTSTTLNADNLTSVSVATSTAASTINIGTGAVASGTKTVNIGTGSASGSTTNINIGSTNGTTSTKINGNVTIGDVSKTVVVTGTISGGIKFFDSDASHTYTLTTGNVVADTIITLPTTSGSYLTVGLRSDGLIDLKSIMTGVGSTALIPSAGGIVWTDSNGFQILSGTTAGKTLISGNGVTPSWSTGTLNLGTNFTTSTGTVTIIGNLANTSQLTLPAGNLTLPSSIVAGDIIYGSGTGTLTRLAKVVTGSVLISGNTPSWSATPTITSLTLSSATGGLAFSGATSADISASTALTANIFTTTASTINIGGAIASTVLNLLGDTTTGIVNINSTKASTNATSGALVVDGGVGIAGTLFTGNNATFAGNITFGGGDLISTKATTNLFNTTVTTLNMLETASSTLNIGGATANGSTRKVNMYSDLQLGSSSYERYLDLYGDMRVGGPAGFAIDWNATDSSLDFIKL